MNKILQTILVALVVSIGVGLRLSLIGWLFIFGIGSCLFFSGLHFFIHFFSMKYLSKFGILKIFLILISHALFICIFIFQVEAGDTESASVFGLLFNIKSKFLIDYGYGFVFASAFLYFGVGFLIVRGAILSKQKGTNIRYMIPAIVISVILPIVFIHELYSFKEKQQIEKLESTGEFNSIKRAMEKPNDVRILRLNPYDLKIKAFPAEIYNLHNLQIIDFTNQEIQKIPDDIYRLKHLEVLNLMGNNIHEIPNSICQCQSLHELQIEGDFYKFPDCLKGMKTLKTLAIRSDAANVLMDELIDFKNLDTAIFSTIKVRFDNKKMDTIEKQTHIVLY